MLISSIQINTHGGKSKKVMRRLVSAFLLILRDCSCGFFDYSPGNFQDGLIFEHNDAAIGAGLNVLGDDLAIFVFLGSEIISDGLLFDVELISDSLHTAG